MKRGFPGTILPTKHLALEMMPSKSESGQRPASSHALSTRRWSQQPRAQEKRPLSLESSTFHLCEEESEHEDEDTSTSEDDLLKLLGIPDDTQNLDSFPQESENLSHDVITRTLVGECYGTTHD